MLQRLQVCGSKRLDCNAILAIRMPIGVAPELNLRNALHADKKTCKWRIHPGFETQGRRHQKFKTGISVTSRKGLMSSKTFKGKCCIRVNLWWRWKENCRFRSVWTVHYKPVKFSTTFNYNRMETVNLPSRPHLIDSKRRINNLSLCTFAESLSGWKI